MMISVVSRQILWLLREDMWYELELLICFKMMKCNPLPLAHLLKKMMVKQYFEKLSEVASFPFIKTCSFHKTPLPQNLKITVYNGRCH